MSPISSTRASADLGDVEYSTPMQIEEHYHVPSSTSAVPNTHMSAEDDGSVPQSPSAVPRTPLPKEEVWPWERSAAPAQTLSASTSTGPATVQTVKIAGEDDLNVKTPTQNELLTAHTEEEIPPTTMSNRDLEKRQKQKAAKAKHKNAGKETLNDLRKRLEENDEQLHERRTSTFLARETVLGGLQRGVHRCQHPSP